MRSFAEWNDGSERRPPFSTESRRVASAAAVEASQRKAPPTQVDGAVLPIVARSGSISASRIPVTDSRVRPGSRVGTIAPVRPVARVVAVIGIPRGVVAVVRSVVTVVAEAESHAERERRRVRNVIGHVVRIRVIRTRVRAGLIVPLLLRLLLLLLGLLLRLFLLRRQLLLLGLLLVLGRGLGLEHRGDHLVGDAGLLELVEVLGLETELLVAELDLANDQLIGHAVLAHPADVADPERPRRLRKDETGREEDGPVQVRASHGEAFFLPASAPIGGIPWPCFSGERCRVLLPTMMEEGRPRIK